MTKREFKRKNQSKGFHALSNKQNSAPFNSEQNDEDNSYNDAEDGKLLHIIEKTCQSQSHKHVLPVQAQNC